MSENGFEKIVPVKGVYYWVTNMREHENPHQDCFWDEDGIAVFRTISVIGLDALKVRRGAFLSATSSIFKEAKRLALL